MNTKYSFTQVVATSIAFAVALAAWAVAALAVTYVGFLLQECING